MDWLETVELERGERRSLIEKHLDASGVFEAAQVASIFDELLELPIFAVAAARVTEMLLRAASPRRAMLALQDCVGHLEEMRGDGSPLFVDPILEMFLELAGASPRFAQLLAVDPALLIELGGRAGVEEPLAPEDFRAGFDQVVRRHPSNTDAFDAALRRYRHRQMIRIALRELRDADVRETAAELADLASAALNAALQHHYARLTEQHGAPEPSCAHVVIGMGKLGGRELNFSSDIDLIYLYEHDQGSVGELSMHEFHVKLFERVTKSISRLTDQGRVFRVDLDLRPEGRPGPLANSLAGIERYYETWGRTWERAAWIKGRPVAGDAELGQRVRDLIHPFVYRKSFDLSAIREIVDMKAKIDVDQGKRGRSRLPRGRDLKLGKGGIREIEFFIQSFQLLHAGRDPRLQIYASLEALQGLEAAGLVNARTRELLSNAYLFLRKVEHRIQLVEEQQTHALPTDADALSVLARSLGFADASALEAELNGHMQAVREHFEQLLGRADESNPDLPSPTLLKAVDAGAIEEERVEALADLGAIHPHATLAHICTAARIVGSPFHPRASESQRTLALHFLAECAGSPSFDRAAKHLPDLVRSLTIHQAYLTELDRPASRRGVARVLGASDLLARILVAHPGLLSQVLVAPELPTLAGLSDTLAQRLEGIEGDIEAGLAELRYFKQEETLRTGLMNLAARIETPTVMARLTALAESLIQAAFRLAWDEVVAKFGSPQDPDARIAILAGGTLGAKEMGYRSDVDLSVLYDGKGETEGGRRAAISLPEFYTRVVHRLLSLLSMRTAEGDLYPADMRLRPSGSQGALVASFASFQRYHEKQAQLWERQALIRTRPIVGQADFLEEVGAGLRKAAYEDPLPEDAADRIRTMRERMQKERSDGRRKRQGERPFDLKLGSGGLVEAEFAVQHLLMQHGREHPELRTTSTTDAIFKLAEASVLSRDQSERLAKAYLLLKTTQNWLRVIHDKMLDHVDLTAERLRPVALAVGYEGASAERLLERDLAEASEVIHLAYDDILCGTHRRSRSWRKS